MKKDIKTVMVSKQTLMTMGFTDNTSQTIIRQAKQNLVTEGFSFYNNTRLGLVPWHAVESIIGIKLSEMEGNLNG